jgi:hypothetical protein
MIGSELALAFLFVGVVTRSMLAAFARRQARSFGLEYKRGAPAVLPEVAEAIMARK